MVKIVKETNKVVETLAIIDNIITRNELTQRRNGIYDFKFDCLEEELKSEYIQTDNQVLIDDNLFDIKYIEVNNSVGVTYKVQCDHISYRLLNESVRNFAFTGTPTQILEELLTETDFDAGSVGFTQEIVFNVDRDASKISIIRILANQIGGVLMFSDNGFTINIVEPVNNGKQARIRKNISSITKVIDNREELKTSYSIDLVNIYKSDDLIIEGFEDFEVLTIYDIINLIDEVLGIEVLQDVVEVKKDVIKDEKTDLMITNTLDDITDDLNVLKQNTVGKDEYIYGITINNDDGFIVERNDLLARSIFNAEEFKMQVGNGLGSYTDALFFDPINEEYKFVGNIEASGTITGADFIGGTINIGSGTFQVDSLGNVIANSISIGGGSGIANLSDAGTLATKDNVDLNTDVLNAGDLAFLDTITGVYIDDNSITAPKINVTELSALTANLGTVNAGTINGINIIGSSIVGGSIKIGQTNKEIEIYADPTTGFGTIDFSSSNIKIFDTENGVGILNPTTFYGTVAVQDNGNLVLNGTNVQMTSGNDFTISCGNGVFISQVSDSGIAATIPWVQSQNYLTSGSLSGYATTSYVNNYAVQDLSSQGISLQYISANNTVEVRTNGTYRGAFTLV